MKLSVVIPYKFGDELRKIALDRLLDCIKAQLMKNFEVIVVEEASKNGSFPYKSFCNKYFIIEDKLNRPFNKGWCINVGIRKATSHNVLMLDADVIFGKEYFDKILDFSRTYPNFFHGYDWIVLLPGRDNPVTRISHHANVWASGGSWFTNKDFFFNTLGGMNENYFGYGGEDTDLFWRAKYIYGNQDAPCIDYPIAHYYHHWEPLGQEAPKAKYASKYPKELINLLVKTDLGNPEHPTLINLDQLAY